MMIFNSREMLHKREVTFSDDVPAVVEVVFAKLPGGRVGVVARALAFHHCGPGSISALSVKCGLSLLVFYSAMRGFPPGTPVFPSHQKPTFDLI